MTSGQNTDPSCGNKNKHECILCAVPVCSRPDCSVAEKRDDTGEWDANKRVLNCRDKNIRPMETV